MSRKYLFLSVFAIFVISAMFLMRSAGFSGHGFLAALNLSGASSSANDAEDILNSSTTIASAFEQLQNQVQLLHNQLSDLKAEVEINNLRNVFKRNLKQGDSGDDVSKLQDLLSQFPEFYPSDVNPSDTVTGYYGSLTKNAVLQFQSETNLKETGVFDAETREKFFESLLFDDSDNSPMPSIDASAIDDSQNKIYSDIKENIGSMRDQIKNLQDQMNQMSSDLDDVKSEVANSQNASAVAETPDVHAFPQPVPTVIPSQPAITNLQVTNITRIGSQISWQTNLNTTGEVDYSTNSNLENQITAASSSLVASHLFRLANLKNGTKYYYRVISKDQSSTTASSAVQTFMTLQ